jgi:hypothetical protein
MDMISSISLPFLWWEWGLNAGLCECTGGTLPFEPYLYLSMVIFRDGSLANYLPWLAYNLDPPDLSLPSSWDYRQKPLAPGSFISLYGISYCL